MASNDAWRGNGPPKNTVFTRYSQEDVEFMKANAHLTAREVADALSVKYGRKVSTLSVQTLAARWKIKLAPMKRGIQVRSGNTAHDTFYVTSEYLSKRYKLAPAIEKTYNKEAE